MQWVGVAVLLVSLLLVRSDDLAKRATQEIPIFNMAGMGFQHVAFTQAFGNRTDMTPEELEMIRRMMEAPPRYDAPPTSPSAEPPPQPAK
jgi:hypothetical protein